MTFKVVLFATPAVGEPPMMRPMTRPAPAPVPPGPAIGVAAATAATSVADSTRPFASTTCPFASTLRPAALNCAALTTVPAEWLGIADQAGTIEVGKLADLIVLGANPLERIANTLEVQTVIANGRVFAAADLVRPRR